MKKLILTLFLLVAFILAVSATAFALDSSPALIDLSITGNDGEEYLSSSDFSSSDTNYDLILDADVNYLILYMSYSSSDEVYVTYPNGTISVGSTYTRVYIDEDDPDEITITVTADDNTMTTYTIGLSIETADVVLDGLEIIGSDGETYLDEDDFDEDETDYELEIDEVVTYLKLYLDYNDDYDVEVEYDGDDDDVTEYTSYIKVVVDTDNLNEITITVVDDDDNEEVYTIDLSGDGSDNGADELEDLYLNSGSSYSSSSSKELDLHPEFDEDYTDYAVLIPYDEDMKDGSLNLRIYLEDEDVNLEIEGSDIDLDGDDYYDYLFDVPSQGDSVTIDFSVEDVDYSLTVYFAVEDAADDAVLGDMGVFTKKYNSSSYEIDLSPGFDEDEEDYELDIDDDYSKLYLYAEADDDDMVILVEDQLLSGSYWTFDPDAYDEITVIVYAADLDEYMEYTIELSGENSLASMYLYAGTTSGTITMSPSFSSSTYNYVANAANSVNSMYIYTATDKASVKVSQNSGSYITKSSNTTIYYLSEGLNTFDIMVGATHYYLNVYRQTAATSIVASSQYISIDSDTASRIAAYNINGNNFVKLRDLAKLLSGTDQQFSVSYNAASNMITLMSGYSYISVGGELTIPTTYSNAVVSPQSVYLDSSYVYPMAYNIDGNNYYLLRDLAALFDFKITYSGTTVYIDTDCGYGGEATDDDDDSDSDFDFNLKIIGSDGEIYLDEDDFDVDQTDYELEIDEDITYVKLYFDYDEDYDIEVEYNGDDDDVTEYSSYVKVYVDTDDLDEITIIVENEDGDEETYTVSLEED